ncbi:hypothetical protein DL766_005149 [Monosporascus sp. MC13-8B]|uniref:F-box domain-containing protein n=1 Tax=Monosporascus cannonballus TaxID=155416 RepID=A0ABY0HMK2_9PEZI|nr:hypothetical protein DL762_000635 [Monosporascus cannonballus]RYP01420.1 hypothetical protein DL763_000230 [Monosporascus cannonballus]RYP29850.1 hypothetical protein DL766_005149 [Monosporascus sp. MC13-8B]
MAKLRDVPTELLILVLEWLEKIDLQSLIVSQLTSKQFHAVVQDVLANAQNRSLRQDSLSGEKPAVHPLWASIFKGLFNSADCFTEADRRELRFLTLDELRELGYLTLHGDFTLPFRRLPWARTGLGQAAYLRPEASWRSLSLTFGQAPITQLDLVKGYYYGNSFDDFHGDRCDFREYYQVDVPSSSLTMGLFYDVLLCEGASYGNETLAWELLLGKRLRSYDELFEYERFMTDDPDLVEAGEKARQAAILYVRGGSIDEVDRLKPESGTWIPRIIGKKTPKLCSWQGPEADISCWLI